MANIFYPDYLVDTVVDLTLTRLEEYGIVNLILDVDCTLKRYGQQEVAPEILAWLDEMKQAGIGLCLLSNGIGKFSEYVGIPYIAQAMKPFSRGCHQALKRFHFDPAKTAIVGDQIFADVMAGRRSGIKTILVTSIHPEEEPFYTRMKRPFEKIVLYFYHKQQNQSGQLS